jgi:hypothetical protein
MRDLDWVLTRYEARVLTALFRNTQGKTAKSPLAALKMLSIIFSVNPRLLRDPSLMSAWFENFWSLASMAWRR